MKRETLLAIAALVVATVPGCSDPEDRSAADKTERAPTLGSTLPDALLGTFRTDAGDTSYFVTYYPEGDDYCVRTVGTDGNCYAVRATGDASVAAIEHGLVGADGHLVRYVPLLDPKNSCIGEVNEFSWSRSADGFVRTVVHDCHNISEGQQETMTRWTGA